MRRGTPSEWGNGRSTLSRANAGREVMASLLAIGPPFESAHNRTHSVTEVAKRDLSASCSPQVDERGTLSANRTDHEALPIRREGAGATA